MYEANLLGARLGDADLSAANLREANLRAANLVEADLRGADLSWSKNLTQEQINKANGAEWTRLPVRLHHPAHWRRS